MTCQDSTVELFCRVDDALPNHPKHVLASLASSEVATLGLLYGLRGEGQRAFYRWAQKELKALFPRLPERTRLFRLLQQHAHATQHFLAQPSLFCVCDTYGIELIHPLREGRSERQIGRKGKSNRRWIVGAKCFVLCNDAGQIVEWECGGANLHDTVFHCALEAFEDKAIVLCDVLCDKGFKAKAGTPACLKICDRGTWNERMLVETLFSLFTNVLQMKKLQPCLERATGSTGLHRRRFQPLHCLEWGSQTRTRAIRSLKQPAPLDK